MDESLVSILVVGSPIAMVMAGNEYGLGPYQVLKLNTGALVQSDAFSKNYWATVKGEDKEDVITIYTDGSCKNKQGGIGVFWDDNHPLNIAMKMEGEVANNQAEILAFLVACLQVVEGFRYRISSDSFYVLSNLPNLETWKLRGWKKRKGGAILNVEYWKALESVWTVVKEFVQVEYIRAHVGNWGNEAVDGLANHGRELGELITLNDLVSFNKESLVLAAQKIRSR